MIFNWRGDEIQTEIEKTELDGAEEWMKAVVLPASDAICPVDKGTMRDTHDCQRDDGAGEVVCGYGGPAAPYTLNEHEDASLHHHDGQEDHFLEKGYQRNLDSLQDILTRRLGAL